ncbi:hypothetical protein TSTA_065890 [Talaromyces stipitatus ATCC 10500]|uniref:Peptidase A1 domain-containing protein n=1 Tax=Talaromyces stipitatus (strain ATCC 10500 / CBS 375.48 / QM 6759 / NRRL 1006) TaxID=441959 RepID=B8LV86_TALSN|nr:uncharacterized protein TSTA_065890 [Talaromyces stipitatus ATCC 10500]EED23136.1 hypothetical protein TSTA_065890 [Talaromyces stipitatus ATCC 10500]
MAALYTIVATPSHGVIFTSPSRKIHTRKTFEDDAYAIALAGIETFNIGGKLYSDIAFGQLEQYYQNMSGQAIPFGGASGIIGLNYNSMQQPGFPSFMSAMKYQLTGTSQFKACREHSLTSRLEWKCTLDSSRKWQNGTWIFGSLESMDDRADIEWADRNVDQPAWRVNITAISAGSVDSTWSAFDNTYRYPYNATLPDFTFGIGNGTFTIPGTYMPYQRDQAGTTCISIITGDNSTDSSHEYIFGAWWAQLGVLILDYEHSQVGFMNKSTPLPKFTTAALDIIAMN